MSSISTLYDSGNKIAKVVVKKLLVDVLDVNVKVNTPRIYLM